MKTLRQNPPGQSGCLAATGFLGSDVSMGKK